MLNTFKTHKVEQMDVFYTY